MIGTRAIGHAGTLDPFATGLLVLLVGRATRLARFVEQQPKRYVATARLGMRTTTDDLTGAVVPADAEGASRSGGDEALAMVTEQAVRGALSGFIGTHLQRPPAFSAKKVGGQRSYARARRGELVDLAPATVTVYSLALVDYRPPEVTFEATVSPGTYVRALARDLGERLGVGGHLVALRRLAIGPLRVESAVPLAELTPSTPLLTPRQLLAHLPSRELDPASQGKVSHGQPIAVDEGTGEGPVALVAAERLFAVARADGAWLRPIVVLEGE